MSKDESSLAHYAPLYAAKQKMAEIKAAINDFNHWWQPHVTTSRVWALPVAEKKGHYNVSWMPALDQIAFETSYHPQSVDVIATALINFHRYPNDPALNIRRWPGYVVLPAVFGTEMRQRLSEINHDKDELKEIISVIPDGSRPLALRKTFPGEHILAAYRHIHCAQQACAALTFTWQGKNPKNTAITRERLVATLENELKECARNGELTAATQREQEITILSELADDARLVQRTQFAPSPRLIAFYQTPTKSDSTGDEMAHAPLPYFMAQDEIPKIIPLPQWENTGITANSGRKALSYELILPRIRIFSVLDDNG
jgi:hypothetical protein